MKKAIKQSKNQLQRERKEALMSNVLIIIPAYNEEENILKVYHSILKYNESQTKYHFDTIVINDCSKDRTQTICEETQIPTIQLVHNLGIGGAVQTGYKYAYAKGYDIAVQFDGDGQHNVEFVANIIEPILKEECEFVIGSRFIDDSSSEFKSSFSRRVGIKLISKMIRFVTKQKVHDTTSGFRAVNKQIIREFSMKYPTEYPEPITTTELLKNGYRLKEVAVSMNEREGGESSIKAWKTVYYMINVLLTILVMKGRREQRAK